MMPPPVLVGALLFVLQGAPSPTIRIDSREQGRTFFVDPDHPEIRKALRDVSAPPPAGPMPEWVTPPPDAQPWAQRGENAPVRSFNIELTTTASVAEVAAFYREAFTGNGLTIVTESQSQERSRFFEARSSDRMHRVTVNIRRGTRDTNVRLMDHYTLPRP